MKTTPLSILNSLLYISCCLQLAAQKRLVACSLKLAAKKRLVACSLWLVAIFLLTAASCTKEEPKHRDVFRCEINGVPWEAKCENIDPLFGCTAIDCQYYTDTKFLELIAYNDLEGTSEGFHIVKKSNNGGFSLGANDIDFVNAQFNNFQFDFIVNSWFNVIKIDEEKKIIECLFNLQVVSETMDTLSVTNGYFNIKYRP